MKQNPVSYQTDRAEEFRWFEVSDGVCVTGYRGVKDLVAIPAELDGKPVTEIGHSDSLYSGCANVLIPVSVKRIDPLALSPKYQSQDWFKQFELAEDHPYLRHEGDFLLSRDGSRLIACLNNGITEAIIPNGVRIIGRRAFANCRSLSRVTLPDGLECMEDEAFACTNAHELKDMVLPSSLKYHLFRPGERMIYCK